MRSFRTFSSIQSRSFSASHNSLRVVHKKFLDLIRNHDSDGKVSFQLHGNIADINIINPTKRNAISGSMMVDLAEIIDTIEEKNRKQIVLNGLILRSQSGIFSSGADLQLVKDVINTSERGVLMSDFMTDALHRIRNSPMVSVTVLSGPALGGGAELSTCTDFRIMKDDESSNFIQFVHAKIGAFPGWGGLRRLTSIVGRNWALRATGTSCRIPPSQALSIGLVDELYSKEQSEGSKEGEDIETQGLQPGLDFLKPFTSQKYQGSVSAFKRWMILHDTHAASHLTHTTLHPPFIPSSPPHSNHHSHQPSPPSDLALEMAFERQLFGERWCGPDNLEALKATEKIGKKPPSTNSS